jgi:hypothetical protein
MMSRKVDEVIQETPNMCLLLEFSDERLKTKTEESTLLADTGLVVESEHLKIIFN